MRFIACPEKSKFFNDTYHVIDVLVLIPSIIMPVSMAVNDATFTKTLQTGPLQVIMTSQSIFRLLKIARNFPYFRLLVKAMGQSIMSLLVPLYVFLFLAVCFGTLFYLVEKDDNIAVTSIPDGVWWATVTIATVGYGDF